MLTLLLVTTSWSTGDVTPSLLHDVQGYLAFKTSFSDGSNGEGPDWYTPLAPDPAGHGSGYDSTRYITNVQVLTAICDAYADACQWHNGGGSDSAIGVITNNATSNTYVKATIGTIVNGSNPSSKYFVLTPDRPTNIFCTPYVGWALPLSLVKEQCDNDERCDAFIMKTDDSYGQLCSFSPPGVCGDTGLCRLHLKLA